MSAPASTPRTVILVYGIELRLEDKGLLFVNMARQKS